MANLIEQAFNQVRELVLNSLGNLTAKGEVAAEGIPAFNVEIPGDYKNGDISTNVAMVCAKVFRNNPRKIAQMICDEISLEGTFFEKCAAAGAGFINFYYSKEWYSKVIFTVMQEGEHYGETDFGRGKSVLVEFVSANPTGPMHIGNARGGAIGDCLSSVLEKAGFKVSREFYINDAGNQIEKFGKSLSARYEQICSPQGEKLCKENLQLDDFCKAVYGEDGNSENFPMEEDTYRGMDIIAHAKNYFDENGNVLMDKSEQERKERLVEYALPKNIQTLHDDLEKYRIHYDNWFRESTLHKDGSVNKIIQKLVESGHTYEKEGALWFKTTDFGDEKDRVLVRENGVPTYLVPDIAYHYNKLAQRKFDKAVDIFGADHHGYITRIKAAMTALGIDADRLDIVIMQMVNLVKDGEKYKLSKRSGKAITLSTLLEEIPIDAARFFFNLREPNSHFDFDLDQALAQNSQNPVYYVQYAHARICSVLRKMEQEDISLKSFEKSMFEDVNSPEEKELIKLIAQFPDTINDSAAEYDPAKVTKYAVDLASMYHKFYNSCRIKGEQEALMQGRLYISLAVKQTIKNILDMLKITCPESM